MGKISDSASPLGRWHIVVGLVTLSVVLALAACGGGVTTTSTSSSCDNIRNRIAADQLSLQNLQQQSGIPTSTVQAATPTPTQVATTPTPTLQTGTPNPTMPVSTPDPTVQAEITGLQQDIATLQQQARSLNCS